MRKHAAGRQAFTNLPADAIGGPAVDDIGRTLGAKDVVGAEARAHLIASGPTHEAVVTASALELVVAGATDEEVAPGIPEEHIEAPAGSRQDVVAVTSDDCVRPVLTVGEISAPVAHQAVGAGASAQRVAPLTAGERIGAWAARETVVSRPALEPNGHVKVIPHADQIVATARVDADLERKAQAVHEARSTIRAAAAGLEIAPAVVDLVGAETGRPHIDQIRLALGVADRQLVLGQVDDRCGGRRADQSKPDDEQSHHARRQPGHDSLPTLSTWTVQYKPFGQRPFALRICAGRGK